MKKDLMEFSNVKDAITYLNGFQFHGFRLGLERIKTALQALGHPHESYPCIHVAGTNGKGSVCAALSSILQEAGFKVGFYSSPHLVELNERFRINFDPIGDKELKELIEETATLVEKGLELSYFEFTTAMAFSCFRKHGVDFAVIETGLGGRLDATNVITPVVSVITNVSLEHQSYLGSTTNEIAFEKAGIIKKRVPVVAGRLEDTPLKVIEGICKKRNAPLYLLGRDFFIRGHENSRLFDFSSGDISLKNIGFGLGGGFQLENAALAIETCLRLMDQGTRIDHAHIRKGLSGTSWPGRSELLRGKIWAFLDGAHNEAGLEWLLPSVMAISKGISRVKKKVLLWACSNEGGDKDPSAMLQKVAAPFDQVIITEPCGPRKPVTIDEWKEMALTPSCRRVRLVKEYKEALGMILSEGGEETLLVVAGSLYLVGPVRKALIEQGFKRAKQKWNSD